MNGVLTPDLAIVGAGPAGLGAAIAAREAGIDTVVVDDQSAPGGQIWRGVEDAGVQRRLLLGPDYARGADVVARFRDSGAAYYPLTTVWNVGMAPPTLDCASAAGGFEVRPKHLILATGALERAVPIPGWTLPGVTTAGALQILLKTSGLVADGAVLAGSGPLLWLLAAQMIDAGTPPAALVETVSPVRYLAATPLLPAALRAPAPLAKGARLIAKVLRHGVPCYRGARDLALAGETSVERIRFRDWRGRTRSLETGHVALHQGVVPNPQTTRLLRVPHDWCERQASFVPRRDAALAIAPSIHLAGDGARIGGADVAYLEGRRAALAIAGRGDNADCARALREAEASRPFLDRLYAPTTDVRRPADPVIVCRCERVTAGALRRAGREGAVGPNQAKFFLRAGMGPCQGRVCGLAASELVAEGGRINPSDAGYYHIRPPLKPLPLSLIASATVEESD